MKLFYLSIALAITSSLIAQENTTARKVPAPTEFSEVVSVDSFPAAQFYFNSTLFLNSAFHGARQSAQIRDEKGKMVATKASIPVTIENAEGDVIEAKTYFTLAIQSREGMYRYTINDFYFAYTEETGITSYASFNDRKGVFMTKKQWQQVETQTEKFVQNFIQELKEQMLQKEVLCKEVLQANKKKKELKR